MLGQLTLSWQTYTHMIIKNRAANWSPLSSVYPSIRLEFALTLLQLSDRLFQHLYTCVASFLTGLQAFYLLAETMHLCLGLILQTHIQTEKEGCSCSYVYCYWYTLCHFRSSMCVSLTFSFTVETNFVHGINGHVRNKNMSKVKSYKCFFCFFLWEVNVCTMCPVYVFNVLNLYDFVFCGTQKENLWRMY